MLRGLLLYALCALALFGAQLPPLSPEQLAEVTARIYQNECSADPDNLVVWNEGEEFASLGIGHFIWYPKGAKKPYVESFPLLLGYMRKNGILIPPFLSRTSAPWRDKKAFDDEVAYKSKLKSFLATTMHAQTHFMVARLNLSLEKMKRHSSKALEKAFFRVYGAKGGVYALIDYVNFKGEGTDPSERYNGKGWGLAQVLECMDEDSEPLDAYVTCASKLLTVRVQNAPKMRKEERWIKGWIARVERYRE